MKKFSKMKQRDRLQLLSFTLGESSYIPDLESRLQISRLEMITVIHHAGKQTDETISPGSESRLSGRNARTNS